VALRLDESVVKNRGLEVKEKCERSVAMLFGYAGESLNFIQKLTDEI
jgi:hypothetical protein